jgi:hypothetical protein
VRAGSEGGGDEEVEVGRLTVLGFTALVLVVVGGAPALAHGDALLVDEVVVLGAGEVATYDGELHYHRLVGQVASDGPVRVRLVAAGGTDDVVSVGPGTRLVFNELVRCCDEVWAPHTLLLENVGGGPVTVTARAVLVHDDLAVMVDGVEDGTRASIVLFGLGWSALLWRATRRRAAARDRARVGGRDRERPLRRPAVGLALLTLFVLGMGSYAAVRYGAGGAPSVVAGNADLPVLPRNPFVFRASLLLGVALIGWSLIVVWWARARPSTARGRWSVLGLSLVASVLVVAVAITVAYGGPAIQVAWTAAVAGPVLVVLATSVRDATDAPARSLRPDGAPSPS